MAFACGVTRDLLVSRVPLALLSPLEISLGLLGGRDSDCGNRHSPDAGHPAHHGRLGSDSPGCLCDNRGHHGHRGKRRSRRCPCDYNDQCCRRRGGYRYSTRTLPVHPLRGLLTELPNAGRQCILGRDEWGRCRQHRRRRVCGRTRWDPVSSSDLRLATPHAGPSPN